MDDINLFAELSSQNGHVWSCMKHEGWLSLLDAVFLILVLAILADAFDCYVYIFFFRSSSWISAGFCFSACISTTNSEAYHWFLCMPNTRRILCMPNTRRILQGFCACQTQEERWTVLKPELATRHSEESMKFGEILWTVSCIFFPLLKIEYNLASVC